MEPIGDGSVEVVTVRNSTSVKGAFLVVLSRNLLLLLLLLLLVLPRVRLLNTVFS